MTEKLDLVFLCAGRGTRVGLDLPKQFALLCGKPVMIYSLEVYERIPQVGRKIIVHEPPEAERITRLLHDYNITNWTLVAGGDTRQDSVRRGLARAETERIFTHNAAVPLITAQMVEQVLAIDADCVTTASEIKDNLVRVEGDALIPVSRKGLRIVNSPQTFRTALFRHAHDSASAQGLQFNSDAELMLHYNHSVRLVPAPSWSFKITDRVDLALAETILARPDLFPVFHRK